jgi:hypothetical protein
VAVSDASSAHSHRVTPRLPVDYADALALAGAGIDADTIARRLAIPIEALAPLLQIAAAKLRALLEGDDTVNLADEHPIPTEHRR